MATLAGQTIASSYEQLLSLPDGGGNANTLVAVTDGDGGTTFGIKLATNKVEIIPGSNDANAFEVSQADGTAVLTVNTSTLGVTITSTGVNAEPCLAIDNTSSSSFIHTIEALGANMTSGQTNLINVGKEGSTKNSAIFGYKFSSAGSNDNLLTLEHWGTGPLQTIDGVGNVTFLGNGSDQTTKWHSGSAYVNAKLDVRQLAIAFSGSDKVTSDTSGNFTFSGNVGLGGSPVSMLHLRKASGEFGIRLTNDATGHTTGDGGFIHLDANNDLDIGTKDSTNFIFKTANTERMRIQSDGKVGIGTSSPASELHINDGSLRVVGSNERILVIEDGGQNSVELGHSTSSTHDGFMALTDDSGTTQVLLTSGTNANYINNGNLGLGTTSPLDKLDIIDGNARIRVGGLGLIQLKNDGSNHGLIIANNNGGSETLRFHTSGDSFLNGGDVHIGGTSPDAKFHVSGQSKFQTDSEPVIIVAGSEGATDHTNENSALCIDFRNLSTTNGVASGIVGLDKDGLELTKVLLVTDNHDGNDGSIRFHTSTDSSSNHLLERMRIAHNGKVGIGQDDPSAGRLEIRVSGDGERALQLTNTDSNQTSSDETMRISLTGDTSPSNPRLIGFEDGDSQIGGIVATSGTTVEYSTSSDYRLKENEKAITDGLERVNKLKPLRFNWKKIPDKIVDGFFAHEVAEVVPEAVIGEKDATRIHDRTEREIVDPQLLNVSRLIPILVASVQELSAKVTELENKLGE